MFFNIEKDCSLLHHNMIEHFLPYFTLVNDWIYFYKTNKVPKDDIAWYRAFAEEYYDRYQRLIDHEYLSYTKAILRRTYDDGQKVASRLLAICDVQAYEPWQFLRIISTYVCLNSKEMMHSFVNYDEIYACFSPSMSSEDILFRSCEVIDFANRAVLETIGKNSGMEEQIEFYLSNAKGSFFTLFEGSVEEDDAFSSKMIGPLEKFQFQKNQVDAAQKRFYKAISCYLPKDNGKVK